MGNSFFALVLDVEIFREMSDFQDDVNDLVEYVKSSRKQAGFDRILVPGEPEELTWTERERDGIPVDEETWRQISEVAERLGVRV